MDRYTVNTFFIGVLKDVGKGHSRFAWARSTRTSCPLTAVQLLDTPTCSRPSRRTAPRIKVVLSDNGREFCGTERHAYELYLALNEIEHRTTKVGSPRTTDVIDSLLFVGRCYHRGAHGRLRGEEQGAVRALPRSLIVDLFVRQKAQEDT